MVMLALQRTMRRVISLTENQIIAGVDQVLDSTMGQHDPQVHVFVPRYRYLVSSFHVALFQFVLTTTTEMMVIHSQTSEKHDVE
jgi:hypothetical protein